MFVNMSSSWPSCAHCFLLLPLVHPVAASRTSRCVFAVFDTPLRCFALLRSHLCGKSQAAVGACHIQAALEDLGKLCVEYVDEQSTVVEVALGTRWTVQSASTPIDGVVHFFRKIGRSERET